VCAGGIPGIPSADEAGVRILIATDSYPPLIGGATRAAQLLAHELAARGHAVQVATLAQSDAADDEDDAGVPVARLQPTAIRVQGLRANPYRRVPPPFPDPELTFRLRRLTTRFRPDVVHAYGWFAYSCAVALTGTSTPLLLSARDYGNFCAVRTLMQDEERCSGPAPRKCLACAGGFYGRAKGAAAVAGVLGGRRLLRRRVAGLHSVSRFVEDVTREHLLGDASPGPATAVIPDFRDPTGPLRADAEAPLPADPYILYVGALRRVKGVEVLLAAWQALEAPPPLVMLGTRTRDTPEAFPPGVTVVVDAPHALVMRAWEGALFGVAPSVWFEPLGNVVHEAQSQGRAVIGTTPGGHDDMITHGEDGLLVAAGDVPALSAAMRRLIDDPAARERMGERGRARAARFTAERVVPEFEALYRELVAAT
jgi:glycosyltransferase involved in cell wall biosynthesis